MPPSHTQQAEALFDAISSGYEEAFSDLQPIHSAVKWVVNSLSAAQIHPARIVDIGCGTGRPVVVTLAEAGHSVLGIDLSAGMIAEARKRVPLPNAIFEKIDTRDFNPPDESFDAVTLTFSLIAGVSQEDIRQAIAKFYRILKKGGLLMFATVAAEGNEVEIRWMGRPVVVSGLSKEELVEEMKRVGFEIEKTEESTFKPVKAVDVGLCGEGDVWEEGHLWVFARKPKA